MLSALTTLEDGAAVDFQVFTSTLISGPEDIDTAALDRPVGEALEGAVRLGIAQAVWTPPEGYDPFDYDTWFEAHDEAALIADPALLWAKRPSVQAPLFQVSGGGTVAVSEPPGQDLRRIRWTDPDGKHVVEPSTALAFDAYGRVLQVDVANRRHMTVDRPTATTHRVLRVRSTDSPPYVEKA